MPFSLERLAKHFQLLADAKRLSHAYIFYGPDSAVPLEFSRCLFSRLYTAPALPSNGSSDLFFLDAANSSSLGIDLIRDLKHFLSLHPRDSAVRLGLVIGADRLTREAQNAMLKITEDPPAHSLIILIASHPDQLLSTLSSRLEKFYFPSPPALASVPAFWRERARFFLNKPPAAVSRLIKELTSADDAAVSVPKLISALIFELDQVQPCPWRALRTALDSYAHLSEYQLNRRLELESLAFELRRLERL